MRHRSFLLVAAACLLAGGAGCAASGPPTLDTGVSRDVPANEVTPAQAQLACARYERLANAALGADVQREFVCAAFGITAQLTNQGSCEEASTSCLADAPAGTSFDFGCELATSFAPSGCTATIGELEDCVNVVAAGIDRFKSRVDCGLLDDPADVTNLPVYATAVGDPAAYPECSSLSVECQGLLGWAATGLEPLSGP